MAAQEKNALIREVFEIVRDIVWAESVDAEAKRSGLDASALEKFRPAFNRHLEREWEQWKTEAQEYSIVRLEAMRMDYVAQTDALRMQQRTAEQGAQGRFDQMLDQHAKQGNRPTGRERNKAPER